MMDKSRVSSTIVRDKLYNIEFKTGVIETHENVDIHELDNRYNLNKVSKIAIICKYFIVLATFILYICAMVYLKLFINKKYNLNLQVIVKLEIIALMLVSCFITIFIPNDRHERDYIRKNLCDMCPFMLILSVLIYIIVSIIVDGILIHR